MKSINLLMVLVILLTPLSVQAVNDYDSLIEKANEHKIVSLISEKYESIKINIEHEFIEDESIILVFKENKLHSIQESYDGNIDLELTLTKDDIIYLMDNWKSMSSFDKIKFMIKMDMPLRDIFNLATMSMSMRGEI